MFRRLAGDRAGAGSDGERLGAGGASSSGRLDLVEEARRPFAEAATDINGALVYMDEGAGEAAHFACGAGFLFSLGALNVLSLEAVGSGGGSVDDDDKNNSSGGRGRDDDAHDDEDDHDAAAPHHRRSQPVDVSGLPSPPDSPVVIFTTRMLQAAKGDVTRCIAAHPTASRVTVFCTVSEVWVVRVGCVGHSLSISRCPLFYSPRCAPQKIHQ